MTEVRQQRAARRPSTVLRVTNAFVSSRLFWIGAAAALSLAVWEEMQTPCWGILLLAMTLLGLADACIRAVEAWVRRQSTT